VGRPDERDECAVSSQVLVDPLERHRVVPMVAACWKERRQIDDVGAERIDVVEVILDAREIAAVVLAIRVAQVRVGGGVPLLRNAPPRRDAALAALSEPVDEHLVHDGVEVPARPAGVAHETEVAERGHLVWMDAVPVQAPVSASAAGKEPAVRDDRAPQRQLGPPPDFPACARRRRRFDQARLAVPGVSEHDRLGVAFGSPQAELGRVAKPLDVELGAVVVRLIEPRHAVAHAVRFEELFGAIHRN
jgi:hypothetical protein